MKRKLLAIVLSTVMALSLVACGSKEPAEESTKTAEEVKEEQIRAEIEDEATEGAVEALVEHVVGEEEADTRIKKVDDIPKEVWDACVASANQRIEEISDYDYKLVKAYIRSRIEDKEDNTLLLLYEFNMGDGTVKYAPMVFININKGTTEEISRCWTMELKFVETIEDYSNNFSEDTVILDERTFE